MDKLEQRQIWADRVADFQESGLTMKDWCEKTGHALEQLKYWKYKYKNKPFGSDAWLPVTVTEETAIAMELSSSAPHLTLQIQMGSIRIDVYEGVQPEILRDVLHVLVSPC